MSPEFSYGVRNNIGPWIIHVSPGNFATAPATPSGLTANATAKGIQLNWAANSEPDLLEYTINRHTQNLFGVSSAFATARANAFLDTKVTAETSYYYWLRASNTSGLSSPIHPGSTAGVFAYAKPIATFAELTNVNCTAIFVSAGATSSVAEVLFTTHSGNCFIDGSFLANVKSATIGDLAYMLRVKPHGVNSSGTWEELVIRSLTFPPSSSVEVRLVTTEVLSSDTYFFQISAGTLVGGQMHATNRHISVNEVLES